MAERLSISRAWDETRATVAADGRLLVAVALALIALPQSLMQFLYPGSGGMTRTPQSLTELLLMIFVGIIGIIGQLAIIRLAIGPSLTVGEAITHGARRALPYIGAVLIMIAAVLLLAVPFGFLLASMGVSFEPGGPPPPAGALVVGLIFLVLVIYLAIRMLMTSTVASSEQAGPIGILKRSWRLTSGHWWRLFGFVVLFVIGVIILISAITLTLGLIAGIWTGPVEPGSAAALVIALVEAVVSALATMLFVVMLARIYVQMSGDVAEPSVPTSGT